MTVRSHLPWPLRSALFALVLGFSAALAVWAFETGKDIAGLDKGAKAELTRLRNELGQLRDERDKAQSIANTAESLLRTERVAQERLAAQLRQAESESLSLKADLGFFERLLPATGQTEGLTVRGLQVDAESPGHWRYQVLVMQSGRSAVAFSGRYELTLMGLRDGQAWSVGLPGGQLPLQVRQYTRVEGRIDGPPGAVVKSAYVRVIDGAGVVRATQTLKL